MVRTQSKDLVTANSTIDNLRIEFRTVSSENASNIRKLKHETFVSSGAVTNVNNLRTTLGTLLDQLNARNSVNLDLNRQVVNRTRENTFLTQNISEQATKINALKSDKSEMSYQLLMANSKIEKHVEYRTQINQRYTDVLVTLSYQAESLESENSTITRINHFRGEMRTVMLQQESDLETLRDEVHKHESDLKRYRTQLISTISSLLLKPKCRMTPEVLDVVSRCLADTEPKTIKIVGFKSYFIEVLSKNTFQEADYSNLSIRSVLVNLFDWAQDKTALSTPDAFVLTRRVGLELQSTKDTCVAMFVYFILKRLLGAQNGRGYKDLLPAIITIVFCRFMDQCNGMFPGYYTRDMSYDR